MTAKHESIVVHNGARRSGNTISFYGYFQITAAISGSTEIFKITAPTLLDGTVCCINTSTGVSIPCYVGSNGIITNDHSISAGYYVFVGALLIA